METHTKSRGQRGLGRDSLALLDRIRAILADRAPITVRCICYQLFVDGFLPSMDVKHTKRISRLTVLGRERGIIDWDDIVDETREVERAPMWSDLKGFASAIEHGYRKDYWTTQPYNVQVWSEKATVGGIMRPVIHEYGVPFLPVGGFGSATKVHEAAQKASRDDRLLVVLYVGDHDPSGRFMSDADLPRRLREYGILHFSIDRIALIEDDLAAIPAFPAKYSHFRMSCRVVRESLVSYEGLL
jgi:hypothetical protein